MMKVSIKHPLLLLLLLCDSPSVASFTVPQSRPTWPSSLAKTWRSTKTEPISYPSKLSPQWRSAPQQSRSQLALAFSPHDLLLAKDMIETTATAASLNFLQSYGDLLKQHPITTKSITAAVLGCIGDAIAQKRSGADKYDVTRGVSFLFFGALYTGAFQHFWFTYLSDHIADWGDAIGVWGPQREAYPVDLIFDLDQWWKYFDIVSQLEHPPSPTALAVGKTLVNQFLVIPVVYMPLFLTYTGLVSGLTTKETVARAQSLYVPLLQRNWFFWLPAQCIQFLVIPSDFQIPFLSVASLVWTIILSSISGTAAPSQIVSYEEDEEGELQVVQVEAGAVNEVTDDIRLEDVQNALIPEQVSNAAADVSTKLVTSGVAVGLLASSADEGLIGEAVGDIINAEIGGGVAVATAVGAGVGLLAAAALKAATDSNTNTTYVDDIDDTVLELTTNTTVTSLSDDIDGKEMDRDPSSNESVRLKKDRASEEKNDIDATTSADSQKEIHREFEESFSRR